MEIEGIVKIIMPARGGMGSSGKAWAAQSIVLEYQRQEYINHVLLDIFGQDRIDMFNLQVGERITAHFDINAHEYNGKWYNDLRVWRVVRPEGNPQAAACVPDKVVAPTYTRPQGAVQTYPPRPSAPAPQPAQPTYSDPELPF